MRLGNYASTTTPPRKGSYADTDRGNGPRAERPAKEQQEGSFVTRDGRTPPPPPGDFVSRFVSRG